MEGIKHRLLSAEALDCRTSEDEFGGAENAGRLLRRSIQGGPGTISSTVDSIRSTRRRSILGLLRFDVT